jgi:hypothetical protein
VLDQRRALEMRHEPAEKREVVVRERGGADPAHQRDERHDRAFPQRHQPDGVLHAEGSEKIVEVLGLHEFPVGHDRLAILDGSGEDEVRTREQEDVALRVVGLVRLLQLRILRPDVALHLCPLGLAVLEIEADQFAAKFCGQRLEQVRPAPGVAGRSVGELDEVEECRWGRRHFSPVRGFPGGVGTAFRNTPLCSKSQSYDWETQP